MYMQGTDSLHVPLEYSALSNVLFVLYMLLYVYGPHGCTEHSEEIDIITISEVP